MVAETMSQAMMAVEVTSPDRRSRITSCCSPQPMSDSGDRHADIARVLEVLKDTVKVDLLRKIRNAGPCVNRLDLFQSLDTGTYLDHLRALRAVGLVQGVIEGPSPCYCLNKVTIERVRAAHLID
jgi:hypothetical protein